jgi:hypothetical protein
MFLVNKYEKKIEINGNTIKYLNRRIDEINSGNNSNLDHIKNM